MLSNWISYSTISYFSLIKVIPGGKLNGSRLPSISWNMDKTNYATSSYRVPYPDDAIPQQHAAVIANLGQPDGNTAPGGGSSIMFQRPALHNLQCIKICILMPAYNRGQKA